MQDPQLCLTVSTTLRDRQLALTSQRKSLFDLISSHGGKIEDKDPPPEAPVPEPQTDDDPALDEFEEINLLDGLESRKPLAFLEFQRLSALQLGWTCSYPAHASVPL